MTHLTSNQDRIYIYPDDGIKPIKLVYERPDEVMWDKDSCTINFKFPISSTFSFNDWTISLFDNLFEKYYGDDINGKNVKPDAFHFKSLL